MKPKRVLKDIENGMAVALVIADGGPRQDELIYTAVSTWSYQNSTNQLPMSDFLKQMFRRSLDLHLKERTYRLLASVMAAEDHEWFATNLTVADRDHEGSPARIIFKSRAEGLLEYVDALAAVGLAGAEPDWVTQLREKLLAENAAVFFSKFRRGEPTEYFEVLFARAVEARLMLAPACRGLFLVGGTRRICLECSESGLVLEPQLIEYIDHHATLCREENIGYAPESFLMMWQIIAVTNMPRYRDVLDDFAGADDSEFSTLINTPKSEITDIQRERANLVLDVTAFQVRDAITILKRLHEFKTDDSDHEAMIEYIKMFLIDVDYVITELEALLK